MGAVRLLVEAGVDNWIAGPTLNIFNPTTLQLGDRPRARRAGRSPPRCRARRSPRVRAALARPIGPRPSPYGCRHWRTPARGFTARHSQPAKGHCEFRCPSIMDGITLRTSARARPS